MNDNRIKKKYLKKIDELKKHNFYYYNENKPIIDDAKYDLLKFEILELEKRYKFLRSGYSPNKKVGF